MSWFEDSNIKKSYIVQTVSDVGIFSACTQVYLTNISPCVGDTINITGNLGVSGNISGTTYFGDGSQLSGIVTTDNFVTGGVYSASSETLYFTGTTGFTPFSVDVSALLDNTNNYVTGGTYNSSTDIVTLTRNDNVNINITGISNTFTTGATYNEGTELITFVRNDGNSYTADLAAIASATTNSFTTGATLNGNIIEFANSVLGLDYYNVDLTSIVSGSTNGFTTGATLNGNIIEFANNLLGLDYYNVDLTSLVSGFTTGNTLQEVLDNGATYVGDDVLSITHSGATSETLLAKNRNAIIIQIKETGDTKSQIAIDRNEFSVQYPGYNGEYRLNGESWSLVSYNTILESGENGLNFEHNIFGGGGTRGIDFREGDSIIITDSFSGTAGVVYAQDYSSTYSNRSLVDKGYVDGVVSGKVDTTLFNTYTGDTETLLNGKLDTTSFNTYSGSVQTDLDGKVVTTLFNTYTGDTETALDTKLPTTTFNSYTGSVVDVFVSSGNANASTQQLSFTNTTGGTFNVTNSAALFSDNDVNVTGGTYDTNTGCVTFTTNSGTTFDVCGFATGITDTFVTGGTLTGENLVLERNSGVDVGNIDLSGLVSGKLEISLFNTYTGDTQTALGNKLSTTTFNSYTGSVVDVHVSSGSYNSSTGDATYENSTGGTFVVSGFTTAGSNNQIPFTNTSGSNFSYDSDLLSDGQSLTIGNGGTLVTDSLLHLNNGAGKLYGLDIHDFSGGLHTGIDVSINGAASSSGKIGGRFSVIGSGPALQVFGLNVSASDSSAGYASTGTNFAAGKFTGSWSTGDGYGVFIDTRQSNTGDNYGLYINTANAGAGNHYSMQIIDGNETVGGGKFLKDTGDGKAQWASITSTDVSGMVSTTLFNTYTGDTETALGTKTTNTNFTSHTGDTTIHYTKGSINLSDLGSSAHTHSISEVVNLQTNLDAKLSTTLFNTYTGDTETELGNKLETTTFNSYTGSVVDVHVSSGNANAGTQQLSFTNTTGGTFNVTNAAALFSDNDVNVTGGTYNASTGCVTFTTNSATTFDVCGFVTGLTDTFVSGGTLSGNNLVLERNSGVDVGNIDLSGLISNSALVGSYLDERVARWNSTTNTLQNGLIRDDGSTVSINNGPSASNVFFVDNTSLTTSILGQTQDGNSNQTHSIRAINKNGSANNNTYATGILAESTPTGTPSDGIYTAGRFIQGNFSEYSSASQLELTALQIQVDTTTGSDELHGINIDKFDINDAVSGNAYAIKIGGFTGAGVVSGTKYGIYQSGSEKNYLGGVLQLNSVGAAAPVTNLGVDASGNIVSGTTGASEIGELSDAIYLSTNENLGLGDGALVSVTTGVGDQRNVAVGNDAGNKWSGGYSVFIGSKAGDNAVTGNYNVAIGADALGNAASCNTSIAIGSSALLSATGLGNIGIGNSAGSSITSGGRNIFIGRNANGLNTSSYQIAIGDLSTTQASSLALGRSGQILLHGEFATAGRTKLGINLGNTYSAPTANLQVKGNASDTTTFLVENGSGVSIFQVDEDGTITGNGLGDVSKVGTPLDNQVGVWTGDGTIEGSSGLTWNGAKLTVTDGNENTEIRDRYIIIKSDSDDANLYLYGYGSGSNSGEIYLAGSRGTIASPSSTLLGDTIGEIGVFGAVPGFRQGARILFQATENFVDTSNYGTKFVIQTATNGSSTLTTRYTIDGDGNHTLNGKVEVASTANKGIDLTHNPSTSGTAIGHNLDLTGNASTGTAYGFYSKVDTSLGGSAYGGWFRVLGSDGAAVGNYGSVEGSVVGASYGAYNLISIAGTNTSGGSMYASQNTITVSTSGTHGASMFGSSVDLNYNKVGGTLTNAFGFYSTGIVCDDSGSSITNAYGIYLGDNTGAGTITNSYGVYQAGADDENYFAGKVGIGTTTPYSILDVSGSKGDLELILDNEGSNKINQLRLVGTDAEYIQLLSINSTTTNSNLQFGIIGPSSTTNDVGSTDDSFILSSSAADNMNFINNAGGNTDNIGFYVGKTVGSNLSTVTPDLIILGSGTNKGNVGVGTATPTEKLEVDGNAKINGLLNLVNTTSGTPVTNLALDANDNVVAATSSNDGVTTVKMFNATPDQELYDDGNIEIHLDDAATDDIEVKVLTNPSSGNVQFGWWSPSDTSAGSASLNIASGQTPLNGNFGDDDTMQIRIFAPSDSSYPYWEVNITKGPSGDPLVIRVTKWSSYD